MNPDQSVREVALVQIRVKLYSILRDYHGSSELTVDIPEEARVRDLLSLLKRRSPGLKRALDAIEDNVVVVDDKGRILGLDDKISSQTINLMPPPEGGSGNIRWGILKTSESIDVSSLVREASSSCNVGAIVVFVGVVRRENLGGRVSFLEYEDAGELSVDKLGEVVRDVATKYSLCYASAFHYTGRLRPGDVTMVIVVGGRTRAEAYPALEELVDRVKHEVPIWKKEIHEDGRIIYILGGRVVEASSSRSDSP